MNSLNKRFQYNCQLNTAASIILQGTSQTLGNIFMKGDNIGINNTAPSVILDIIGSVRVSQGTLVATNETIENSVITNVTISNAVFTSEFSSLSGVFTTLTSGSLSSSTGTLISTAGSIGVGSGGSLTVLGGSAFSKDLYLGGNLNISNTASGISQVGLSGSTLIITNSAANGVINVNTNNGAIKFYTGLNSNTYAGGFDSLTNFFVIGGLNVSGNITVGGSLNMYGSTALVFNSNTLGNLYTTGGNVGIATTNPTYTLDVNGTSRFTNNIHINYAGSAGIPQLSISPTSNGSEASICFWQNTSESGTAWVAGHNPGSAGSSNFAIYNTSYAANVITMTSTGNVGIHTNSPSTPMCINTSGTTSNGVLQILSISGGKQQDGAAFQAAIDNNIIIAFLNAAGTQRGYIAGNGSSAVTYITSSDQRLKENVVNIKNGLDVVNALRPVTFDWKLETDKHLKSDYGFIAQEVFKLPEFARHRKDLRSYSNCECINNKYHSELCENIDHENPVDAEDKPIHYGLDYSKFTPYLTKAIQELHSELHSEINTLKATIKKLQDNFSKKL